MYLIDTNIISELRKGKNANPGVTALWHSMDENDIYLTVQTIGELRRGVENIRNRNDLPQAKILEDWLDNLIREYADRILGFDTDCAQLWGRLMSPHAQHPIDKQIASIALIHDMTVVTRNVDDFKETGVHMHNPFV